MDPKKLSSMLSLMIIVVFLLGAKLCLAGDTTITGTMSCVMPDLFEFKTPAITASQSAAPQTPQAPIPSGASGRYEVQKEEKLIQTESDAVVKNASGANTKVTIYTVCAK